MIKTASLELSKQLFAISGWDDTFCFYADGESWDADDKPVVVSTDAANWARNESSNGLHKSRICPAYDLGYIRGAILDGLNKGTFAQGEFEVLVARLASALAIGEDRTAEFAIKLFEEGVLERS